MDFVRWLIVISVMGWAGLAFADNVVGSAGVPSQWRLTANGKLQPGFFGSASAACAKAIELLEVESNLGPELSGVFPNRSADCKGRRTGYPAGVYGSANESCPAGTEANVASGKCEAPNNCPPAGTVEGDTGNIYAASSLNSSVCIGEGSTGCVWKPGGAIPGLCANGKCYQFGPFTATGAACDPSAQGGAGKADPVPDDDAKCVGKGKCPGTVNGTKVCVPCGSKSQSDTTSESTESPDTAPSSPDGASSPSSGGNSKSTTKETKCEGGSCTTTTTVTTKDSSGNPSTTKTTKTEPQQSFCTENPKAAVCKGDDDSRWGGSCQSGFQCDGDAVQCAQAQASWKSACLLEVDKSSAEYQAGQGASNDSGHFVKSGTSSTFDLNSFIAQRTGLGPVESCPSDLTFSFAGQAITIPFSTYCPTLRAIGFAGNGVAMLAALGIMFAGRKD